MARTTKCIVLPAVVATFIATTAFADPIATVVETHIDGNVPPADKFAELLRRDLQTYFATSSGAPRTVELEMLRDGPTQSGISFPKYYVWVKVIDAAGKVQEGAARVAAIHEVRFEVTHFVSAHQIRDAPETLQDVFPPPVCDAAIAKAGKLR